MRMHPLAHIKVAINGKIHKPTWREIQTRPCTARMATIAAKAMHGSAPNTPYETMRGDSHTPAAKAIQNKLKPIKRRKSTQEESQLLKQIFPLNPNTRRGCPCCGQEIAEYIVADCQHYAMGHCTRTQKHMTVDFGGEIAAWVICQSCPKTFTTPKPNHPKMRLDIRITNKEKASHIVNPMIPIQIDLSHVTQAKAPTRETTAKTTNQMEEDNFLMECAMAQEIDVFDQEEQQYEDQITEERMKRQNGPETEWDYPAELFVDQPPPYKRLLKPELVE